MICKYIETCAIFSHYLADKPQQAQIIMDKYCKNAYESCARYQLASVIGEDAVPLKLFPDMLQVSNQIIKNYDSKRKSVTSKSQTLIKNIQPEDIFDFALDLLSESSDNALNHSYKGRDSNLRKFSLWFKTDLQNYYARIIQIKIKHTGVRSRKRGKNPLTFFLENLRRSKGVHDSSVGNPEKPEDICEVHFASIKIRIALFRGLRTKPLHTDIIAAIESLLKIEEERLNIGVEGIIKRFNNLS